MESSTEQTPKDYRPIVFPESLPLANVTVHVYQPHEYEIGIILDHNRSDIKWDEFIVFVCMPNKRVIESNFDANKYFKYGGQRSLVTAITATMDLADTYPDVRMFIVDTPIARQYLDYILWAYYTYNHWFFDHNMHRLCDFSMLVDGLTIYEHCMERKLYSRAAKILSVAPKICVSSLIKVAKKCDVDITHLCIRAIDEKSIEYTELLFKLQRECRGKDHEHRLLTAMGKRNI
jgi:hypothetical protein